MSLVLVVNMLILSAQNLKNEPQKALWTQQLSYRFVPSIEQQIKDGTFIPADPVSDKKMMGKDKKWKGNKVVPGKGSSGPDPLLRKQWDAPKKQIRALSDSFITTSNPATPSDPTGAVGADFFISAWNTAFQIFNKSGSPVTPAASLSSLFIESIGDPIVLYDTEADRYIVTQFSAQPNGFHIAVSQTNNPVTGGWHTYFSSNFPTTAFPDYTKFSIWSDGYYVTANISGGNGQVWAIERDEMLQGNPSTIQAFDLPGIQTSGFYSPQVFNISGGQHPSEGSATVVYMQDDAWAGISNDHLKLWTIDVDWNTPVNSTISAATEIPVTNFTGVFDGGGFSNLQQPSGPDIDAIQAAIMNQAQFRKFTTHNSAVFNFVVDAGESEDAGACELAAVRWYELRQTADGQPWTIYQEGTYTAPEGRHAFAASMAMDNNGNIGMGYSSLSNTQSISLRYTGRFDGDQLGVMTAAEGLIAQSSGDNNNNRYADYSHLTVDPTDDSFWFVSEYFDPFRSDIVGVFAIDSPVTKDVGVLAVTGPTNGTLTASEQLTVELFNYGTTPQSNIPVSYTIEGNPTVNEVFSGTIAAGTSVFYTFNATEDMSVPGSEFKIIASTNLVGDLIPSNDSKYVCIKSASLYCEPQSSCSFGDGVTIFNIGTIGHTSSCVSGGYVNNSSVTTDLDRSISNNVHAGTLEVGFDGNQVSIWIDFNDDGDFDDPGEQVLNSLTVLTADTNSPFSITIDPTANLGVHTMRLRAWDPAYTASGLLNNPCDDLSYGRTEDFSVNIIDSTLSLSDFTADQSDFSIISQPNNQYEIILDTPYSDILSFSVFNALGQQVVFNNVSKDYDGKYRYDLDMSYASSGVYIVKFGKGNSFKSGKIIVE